MKAGNCYQNTPNPATGFKWWIPVAIVLPIIAILLIVGLLATFFVLYKRAQNPEVCLKLKHSFNFLEITHLIS